MLWTRPQVEVCELLGLSGGNQRVLLHRRRSRVRASVEHHLGGNGKDYGRARRGCREVVELVTDYLEGRLAVDRRDVFERHLAMCTWCETYLDQMRHTLSVVGYLREDDVPAALVDSLAFTAERAGKSTPEPRFGSE